MCVCMCVSVCVCAQSGVRRGIFLTDMHFVEVNYKWGTFLSFFVFIVQLRLQPQHPQPILSIPVFVADSCPKPEPEEAHGRTGTTLPHAPRAPALSARRRSQARGGDAG
jgi:hypothetical protein